MDKDSEELRTRLNGKLEQYKELVKALPEPNEGRIEELKAAVKNGTLITAQAIRGAANRLYEVFKNGEPPN